MIELPIDTTDDDSTRSAAVVSAPAPTSSSGSEIVTLTSRSDEAPSGNTTRSTKSTRSPTCSGDVNAADDGAATDTRSLGDHRDSASGVV